MQQNNCISTHESAWIIRRRKPPIFKLSPLPSTIRSFINQTKRLTSGAQLIVIILIKTTKSQNGQTGSSGRVSKRQQANCS